MSKGLGFRASYSLERERESWLTFVKQELKPEDLPLQYFQHRQHSALFSLFFASLRESSLSHALFLSRGVVESCNFHFITSQMGANKSGQDTQKRQFLCCIFPINKKHCCKILSSFHFPIISIAHFFKFLEPRSLIGSIINRRMTRCCLNQINGKF